LKPTKRWGSLASSERSLSPSSTGSPRFTQRRLRKSSTEAAFRGLVRASRIPPDRRRPCNGAKYADPLGTRTRGCADVYGEMFKILFIPPAAALGFLHPKGRSMPELRPAVRDGLKPSLIVALCSPKGAFFLVLVDIQECIILNVSRAQERLARDPPSDGSDSAGDDPRLATQHDHPPRRRLRDVAVQDRSQGFRVPPSRGRGVIGRVGRLRIRSGRVVNVWLLATSHLRGASIVGHRPALSDPLGSKAPGHFSRDRARARPASAFTSRATGSRGQPAARRR
jgi:hypothetical protein